MGKGRMLWVVDEQGGLPCDSGQGQDKPIPFAGGLLVWRQVNGPLTFQLMLREDRDPDQKWRS